MPVRNNLEAGDIPLFAVIAQGGGVPSAGLAALINVGNFPLEGLDLVVLFFDEGHKALVARGESGVVEHQLLQGVFSVDRGGSQFIEVPFKGFNIAAVLLELVVEGEMSGFLAGG